MCVGVFVGGWVWHLSIRVKSSVFPCIRLVLNICNIYIYIYICIYLLYIYTFIHLYMYTNVYTSYIYIYTYIYIYYIYLIPILYRGKPKLFTLILKCHTHPPTHTPTHTHTHTLTCMYYTHFILNLYRETQNPQNPNTQMPHIYI